MDDSIDRILNTVVTQTTAFLGPLTKGKQSPIKYLGPLVLLPNFLFLVLGTSLGLHWWHMPLTHSISVGLAWLMAILAMLMALMYGFFSLLFFLVWWRGKLRVDESKRPSMGYSYAMYPLQYALIAIWGFGIATGRNRSPVLLAGMALYIVSVLVLPWLNLLQKPDSDKAAAKQSGR